MKKDFESYYNHIRFIHFSFIILGVVTFYLIFPTWKDKNSLINELDQFRHVMSLASLDSLRFVEGAQALTNQQDSLADQICDCIEARTDVNVKSAVYKGINVNGELKNWSKNNTLSDSKNLLNGTNIHLLGIKKITSDCKDIQSFLQTIKGTSASLDSITIDALRYTESSSAGLCFVKLFITKDNQHFDSSFTKNFIGWNGYSLVTFNDSLFESRYPKLNLYWNKLSNKTFTDAKKWVIDPPIQDMNSISLFDIKLNPQYYGWIAPLFTFTILFYLLSYLKELQLKVKRSSNDIDDLPSGWIGTMQNRWAGFVTWITFLVTPIISVGVPIFYLLQREVLSIIIGLLAFGLSAKCAWLARQIASKENFKIKNRSKNG